MTPPRPTTITTATDAETPVLRVSRLRKGAELPHYRTALAAGLDLSACPEDGASIVLEPGDIRLVACGVALAIPEGYEGQVRARSGLATRHGVTLVNSPGTIDADYRGEVHVPLINHGRAPFVVELGMRIAQLVISPVAGARVVEVAEADELGATDRGAAGFGSTGA